MKIYGTYLLLPLLFILMGCSNGDRVTAMEPLGVVVPVSLSGDVQGNVDQTKVVTVGGASASDLAGAASAVKNATANNVGTSSLMMTDANGNFATSGKLSGSFSGDGSGLVNVNAQTAVAAQSANSAKNFTGTLSGDVTGAQGATVVSAVGGQTATSVASGVALANGATNSNTAGTLVKRDASGNFSAGTITANLIGNATTATTATAATTAASATNFTGSLSGDVSGTQGATVVSKIGGASATNIASAANTVSGASSDLSNGNGGALLKGDGSGNIVINSIKAVTSLVGNLTGNVTGNLNGNATTATTAATAGSATNFTGSLTGDVTGTQEATVVSAVGGQSATNVASGASLANSATSANLSGALVKRDSSGSFAGYVITALSKFIGNVNGNADTATTAQSATFAGSATTAVAATSARTSQTASNFTGSLSGDVTGTQNATVVSTVGGQLASAVASGVKAANSATSNNNISTLVMRDGSGNFSAGTVTANLIGNVLGNITGNLNGTASNAMSASGLQGIPVSTAAPSTVGQVLTWNGNAWAPATPNGGNITGNGVNGFLPQWTGSTALTNSPIYSDGSNVGIGIGATNPSNKLEVNGGDWLGIQLDHNVSGGVATLKWSPAGAYGTGRYLVLSNETPNNIGTGNDGGMIFRINNGPTSGYTAAAMTISQNGNVGIQTTNPATPLDINGAERIRGGAALYLQNPSGDNNATLSATGPSGSANLAINASGGNVGIGTSAPATTLDVAGTPGWGLAQIHLGPNANAPNLQNMVVGDCGGWGSYYRSGLYFGARATNPGTVNGVCSGTAPPITAYPTYTLDDYYEPVYGIESYAFDRMRFLYHAPTYPTTTFTEDTWYETMTVYGSNVGIGNTTPAYPLDVKGDVNTTSCIRIQGTQQLGTCSSDQRLKKDIQTITGALDKITQLRPVHYRLRAEEFPEYQFSKEVEVGLIAQEVEKVFPHLVSTDSHGYRKVNYGLELEMQAIAAIKELKLEKDREIATLKAENAKIQSKLDGLLALTCGDHPKAAICQAVGTSR